METSIGAQIVVLGVITTHEVKKMEEENNVGLLQTCGLHPLVGFGVTVIDTMLFAGEGITLGASIIFVSIPVGVTLGIASILIQKKSFDDDWGLAIGKGILVGLLTAIPTQLPAVVTLSGGALGTLELIRRKRISKPIKRPLLSSFDSLHPETLEKDDA